jgi:hypothetical protein
MPQCLRVAHVALTKEINFSLEVGRRKLTIEENMTLMVDFGHIGPTGFATARQDAARRVTPPSGASANPRKYCVYNQTHERFVVTEVQAVDASPDGAEAGLRAMEQNAGTGLWILRYRGISASSIRFPVDLVFLDNDFVVFATVESFPLAGLPDSGAKVVSVLALPSETVAKGGLRVGDRLLIADPEEMKRHLQRMKEATLQAPIEAAPVRPEIASGKEAGAEELAASPRIEPDAWKRRLGTRNWLTHLLLGDPADPRKALREELPGLIAYFFTGGGPVAHEVRDISLTGVYIITSEGWYPGTLVRVTLTDRDHPTQQRTMTVNAKAVRQGSDGVGLEFILAKENGSGTVMTQSLERAFGVNNVRIDAFLQQLKMPPPQE